MRLLVAEALGRGCPCVHVEHGNPCPDVWHTWRRHDAAGAFCAHLASVFVGRDVAYGKPGAQAGSFKINLTGPAQRDLMIHQAERPGYFVTTDVADPPATFRAVVRPSVAAAHPGPERDFYIAWLQQAVGAF